MCCTLGIANVRILVLAMLCASMLTFGNKAGLTLLLADVLESRLQRNSCKQAPQISFPKNSRTNAKTRHLGFRRTPHAAIVPNTPRFPSSAILLAPNIAAIQSAPVGSSASHSSAVLMILRFVEQGNTRGVCRPSSSSWSAMGVQDYFWRLRGQRISSRQITES